MQVAAASAPMQLHKQGSHGPSMITLRSMTTSFQAGTLQQRSAIPLCIYERSCLYLTSAMYPFQLLAHADYPSVHL